MTKPQFKLVNIDGKNTTDERVVKCFCAENAAQKFATMLCKEIHGESDCTMTRVAGLSGFKPNISLTI